MGARREPPTPPRYTGPTGYGGLPVTFTPDGPVGPGAQPPGGGRGRGRGRGRGDGRRFPFGTSCPDPNMLILMSDGSQKKAGELKVGDLVKTYHEKDLENASKLARNKSLVLSSGEIEKHSKLREQLENSFAKATLGEYKVEYVGIVKDVEKIKFIFNGSEIICSLTHKFFVDGSWKEAKDMVVGDEVSGKKLLSTELVENGDVVHITVEDAHTYICEGLLSHNKRKVRNPDGPRPPRPPVRISEPPRDRIGPIPPPRDTRQPGPTRPPSTRPRSKGDPAPQTEQPQIPGVRPDRGDRPSLPYRITQVTMRDPETGLLYGGSMRYNPDTGKMERDFKTPTREEFLARKEKLDQMRDQRRRNETSDFGSRIGREGPATMDFRDSDGDGTDDRYQRGPGAPDSRPRVGRRRPPSSFSPSKDRSRPRPSFTEASTLDRRNRRDEMRQRRRDEMMRRRERGEFGGRPSFGGGDREDNVGSRPSPSPAVSTVDDSAPRRRPRMGGQDSSDSGNFLNSFVSTLRG